MKRTHKKVVMVMINTFFDGNQWTGEEPIYSGNKYDLGVSKIDIEMNNCELDVTFTLKRVGLLIGRAGITIKALEEHLSVGDKVNVKLIEFDPWTV